MQADEERERARQLIEQAVRDYATSAPETESRTVPLGEQEALTHAVWAAMHQGEWLQTLLDMPGVEKINCTGHDKVFVRYADGREERWPVAVAESDEALGQLVRRLATSGEWGARDAG